MARRQEPTQNLNDPSNIDLVRKLLRSLTEADFTDIVPMLHNIGKDYGLEDVRPGHYMSLLDKMGDKIALRIPEEHNSRRKMIRVRELETVYRAQHALQLLDMRWESLPEKVSEVIRLAPNEDGTVAYTRATIDGDCKEVDGETAFALMRAGAFVEVALNDPDDVNSHYEGGCHLSRI